MFIVYSFLLAVGFVLALPYFLFIAVRDGKYKANFWQRLGYLPKLENEGKPVIWLHCVSVGETNAAKPLVKAILQAFPDYKLVVSTTTATGQKLAQEIFQKEAALIFYFPFDFSFAVRRALQIIQPQAVLIMETEIWLNFLRECRKQNIKTAIVNGRLSEKSFKNYQWIRAFMAKGLQNLDLALMQSEADANRIKNLGLAETKISVTGNVKFDIEEIAETDLTQDLRARFAFDEKRPLIVVASTHAPEEEILRQTLEILAKRFSADEMPRFLIAPRHPERFAEVAKIFENSRFNFVRRSAENAVIDKLSDVILLDSIGELRAVFPLAELVFVGGSLIPHGGQNILEPAAAQKAIVTGFYTMNFAAIIKEFRQNQALIQLDEIPLESAAENLAEVFADLLEDETKRQNLAANAVQVLRKNRGATGRSIEKLREFLRR